MCRAGRAMQATFTRRRMLHSMDSLEGFSPMDTTGFIEIQSIRLKKYGEQKIKEGKPLTES
jgi:argininosuccinate synthase